MSSISQPVRRVLGGNNVVSSIASQCCRALHTTSNLAGRKRFNKTETQAPPRFSARREHLADRFVEDEATDGVPSPNTKRKIRPYSEAQKEALKAYFTEEQLQVIELGEKAVDPRDIAMQARMRMDPGRIPYLDDFGHLRPTLDKKPAAKPPTWKQMQPESLVEDEENGFDELAQHFREVGVQGMDERQEALNNWAIEQGFKSRADMWRAECEANGLDPKDRYDPMEDAIARQLYTSIEGADAHSPFVAPGLGKIEELEGKFVKEAEPDEKDPEGKHTRLKKVTGKTLDEILDLKTKVLVRHRVVNQTRLGKVQSMYVLAIAGNGNGMLGIGEGKATEMDEAMHKARFQAVKSMKPIPRYEDRTIYGEVEGKVSATIVKLMSRPPGM